MYNMDTKEILKVVHDVIDMLYEDVGATGVSRQGCYDLRKSVFRIALIEKLIAGDNHLPTFDKITWWTWQVSDNINQIHWSDEEILEIKTFLEDGLYWPTSFFDAQSVEKLKIAVKEVEARNAYKASYEFRRLEASLYTNNPKIRQFIFARDGRVCKTCGTNRILTLDHIIPVSRGGVDHVENLQVLCRSCNSKKSNKHPQK